VTVGHFALPLLFLLFKWKNAYKKYVNWPGWCPIIDKMSSNEIITCHIIDLLIKDLWFLGITWADGLFSFVLYHLDPPLKCNLRSFFLSNSIALDLYFFLLDLIKFTITSVLFLVVLLSVYNKYTEAAMVIKYYRIPGNFQCKGLVILYNFLCELCALNDHEAARYTIFVLSTMF